MGVCLDPFMFKENIEGAYHIHVSIDSDTSSGFIRNPSVPDFFGKMGSQWVSIDTTLPTAGYCKGSPCNEKRNLISMNWIFCAKLVNRMKQESVR